MMLELTFNCCGFKSQIFIVSGVTFGNNNFITKKKDTIEHHMRSCVK